MHRLPIAACAVALLWAIAGSDAAHAADPAPTTLPAPPSLEAEPNDTTATATPIASGERVRGNVYGAGDADLYSFTAEAGDRVYASTMTGASAGVSTDSRLALLGTDGTTVIEADDDAAAQSGLASSIAGARVPAAGTYYLRVAGYDANITLRPYDLVLQLRAGAPAAEVEPNGSAADPTSLSTGYVEGAIDPARDLDLYAIELAAGDTVALSLDLDPERDGTTFPGRLGFGTTPALNLVDDNGSGDLTDSEAYIATVHTAGTYLVGVDALVRSGGPESTYRLSATVIEAVERSCRTYTVTPPDGAIPDAGSASFPIDVPDAATIDRVAIKVAVTHPFMRDLDATLEAPGGSSIPLFSDIGRQTPMLSLFDDDAAAPVLNAQSIDRYAHQPDFHARLSYFSGQQAAGRWNLTLRDDDTRDSGSLTSADLILCARPDEGPVETVFSAGFETGDDGFTHSGTLDEWERGTPSTPASDSVAGLAGCAGGTGCFKTDLDGTHEPSSSQDLVSPPISLAGRSGAIYASWAMWYQLDDAAEDHATVSVEEVGGEPQPLFTWLGGNMVQAPFGVPPSSVPFAAGWGVHRADLSAYAGKTIRLRFHFDADAGSATTAGLAIDDVRVYQPAVEDVPDTPVPDTSRPRTVVPAASAETPRAQPAISRLRLAARCVRRSSAGRVRVPMTMRLAQPAPLQIRIYRAVGSTNRRSCPARNPTQNRNTRFRPIGTVRDASPRAVTAAVRHRMVLDLRLRPGLYRISVRVHLEDGRLSRPAHRFLRVVG